jgi:uncharacterized membrane protein
VNASRRRLLVLAGLVLASAWSCLLVAARIHHTGSQDFRYLVWNLALAWVPFALALIAYACARRAWAIAALGFGWLLFFPNAPYIATDFIHLRPTGAAPLWYDTLTIGSFAATGLALGFASLYLMQAVVRRELGTAASWIAVVGASGLAGVGVYLGRFLRANSWDVLTNPDLFVRLARVRLADPFGNPKLVAVSFVFTLLISVGYATVYAVAQPLIDDRR